MRSVTKSSEQCFSEMVLYFLLQRPLIFNVFSPQMKNTFHWRTLWFGAVRWLVELFSCLHFLSLIAVTSICYLCHCHRNRGCHFCEVTSIQRDPSTEVSLKYRLCIKHAVAMQICEKEYKKCQTDICECIGKTDFSLRKWNKLNKKNSNTIFLMVQKALFPEQG